MGVNITLAETTLQRPLTPAEIFWITQTANVSDFQLYCSTIVLLLIFYPLASLPYLILDWLRWPFFEQYRIQRGNYNSFSTVWQCFKDVMFTFIVTVGPLQALSYPFFKIAGITGDLPLPSLATMAAQLVVFFIVEDYGNYWLHRMCHYGWLYDNIHYKHHEFNTPVSLSASYAHWAEVLLLGIPSFAGPAIVQCHVITLWAWILLRAWEAIETHSGYDFPWNPLKLIPFYGGADYHDFHHLVGGQSKGNFASVFTYCDWLYGTDKGYRFMKNLRQHEGKKEN